jgi:hypothetical protein
VKRAVQRGISVRAQHLLWDGITAWKALAQMFGRGCELQGCTNPGQLFTPLMPLILLYVGVPKLTQPYSSNPAPIHRYCNSG